MITALGFTYYFGFIKNNEEIFKLSTEKTSLQNQITTLLADKNAIKNESHKDENTTTFFTNDDATKIAQDIYVKAYNEITEGTGLSNDIVEITVGQENTVGGVLNVKAYKLDFSKIEPYFTERVINYIKTEYTDTPYGHSDGNYYIFLTENIYSYEKKEFISTIWGVTDQAKRTFNAKLYDDNMIIAISEKSSFFELDEYLILKKVNNTWKIDMFE